MEPRSQMHTLISVWYDDWFAMDRLYYEWARRHGITGTVLFTLHAIDAIGEACTPAQIVSKLALSKQTVNSTLDTLEKKGFISRTRDMADQRSRIIRLTDEGRRYTDTLLGELYDAESIAFAELGDDLHTMLALNRRLALALRREMGEK